MNWKKTCDWEATLIQFICSCFEISILLVHLLSIPFQLLYVLVRSLACTLFDVVSALWRVPQS
jgi:hypothetical protein